LNKFAYGQLISRM